MTVRLLVLLLLAGSVAGAVLLIRRYFARAEIPPKFDLEDAGEGGPRLVEFVTPYCYECKEVLPLLKAASTVYGTPLTVIDGRERPELLTKYSIRHTPTILVVDRRGSVKAGWLGTPSEEELESALAAV